MAASSLRRAARRQGTSSSTLAMHNVVVDGRRTSVRLEPLMWDALREIAQLQHVGVNDLVTAIDRGREASSLTAAIRVYIVDYYRSAAAGAAEYRQALLA